LGNLQIQKAHSLGVFDGVDMNIIGRSTRRGIGPLVVQ